MVLPNGMKGKLESQLIIFLSYFDEVYGPQILDLHPYEHSGEFTNVVAILSKLIDISSISKEESWQFLYADQEFGSQNLRLSMINSDVRGGLSDIMISIIVKPVHGEFVSAMAYDWKNIHTLRDIISENMEFENKIPTFKGDMTLSDLLESIHDEIIEQFQFFVDSLKPDTYVIR
jgi:hypothetical protein